MRNVVPRSQAASLLDQSAALFGRIVVRLHGREIELAPNRGRIARWLLR